MYRYKSFIWLAASAVSLSAAPASAMRLQHDPVAASLSTSCELPATGAHAPQILFVQGQAPGRPLTPREQETVRVPERPARDPLVRVEPPSSQQPRNPFPPRPENEPRLTNPLSR